MEIEPHECDGWVDPDGEWHRCSVCDAKRRGSRESWAEIDRITEAGRHEEER